MWALTTVLGSASHSVHVINEVHIIYVCKMLNPGMEETKLIVIGNYTAHVSLEFSILNISNV